MITQRYNLNLIPNKVPVIVNCSQYDALSRTIEMTIYDGSALYTIPSGTSASVRGTKQDNTGFEYPCTIDGSKVSFDIQDQMTIFAGKVPCEIRLSKDGGIIGTCNFLLNVEETPLDPDVTISETDLPLLEEAEQNAIRAEQARDEAEQILSSTVKSVNGETPDANGNVDVVALPTGGTADQVLVKQSSTDGDADWENAGIWHGDEVGSLPVPINADQLQGHPASYFATQSDIVVERGSLTLASPFQLFSWGHASYIKQGSLAVINIYGFTCSQNVSSDTLICNLPFTAKGYQGHVTESMTGDRMLIFSYNGQSTVNTNGCTANKEYYAQFLIDVAE